MKKLLKKIITSTLYNLYIFKLFKKEFKGINLGSGTSPINGFLNIDANINSECNVVAGIEKIKLAKDSVGVIYNSHVFEHIPRQDASRVLFKWNKVLKSGGKLYICVPDVEALFKLYLENINHYESDKSRQIIELVTGIIYGGQTDNYDFHFNGYSFKTLENILQKAGYTNIKRINTNDLEFKKLPDASIASVDGVPVSLNIEAQKK